MDIKDNASLDDIKCKVAKLRRFYIKLVIQAIVLLVCLIVWISTGRGHFWPIWVLLGFAIADIFEYSNLGIIPVKSQF